METPRKKKLSHSIVNNLKPSFQDTSRGLPEDTVKYVYCVLDEISSNLRRISLEEDAGLLPLLVGVENAFAHRHIHILQSLPTDDVAVFTTWCLHRLMWIGICAAYRQVYAVGAAVTQLISMLEHNSLEQISSHNELLLDTALVVLDHLRRFDDAESEDNWDDEVAFNCPLEQLSDTAVSSILNGSITLQLLPISLTRVDEAYKLLAIVSHVVRTCMVNFITLKPVLMEKTLRVLSEVVELSDFNGKLEAVVALSRLIEATECMGNTQTPLSLNLSSNLVCATTHALLSLPCLFSVDKVGEDESMEAFQATDGQSRFVGACASLLDHINKILRPSWIYCEGIPLLLQTCVSCLIQNLDVSFPNKRMLIGHILQTLTAFAGTSEFDSDAISKQALNLMLKPFAMDDLLTSSWFTETNQKPSSNNPLRLAKEIDLFLSQVVDFFAVCIHDMGLENAGSVFDEIKIGLNARPDVNWAHVSIMISSLLSCATHKPRWQNLIFTLPDLVIPRLCQTLSNTSALPEYQGVVFKLNCISNLLQASLDECVFVDLTDKNLQVLSKLIADISKCSTVSVDGCSLLTAGLRTAILLTAYCQANSLECSWQKLLPPLLFKLVHTVTILHWLSPLTVSKSYACGDVLSYLADIITHFQVTILHCLSPLTVSKNYACGDVLSYLTDIITQPMQLSEVHQIEGHLKVAAGVAQLAICATWLSVDVVVSNQMQRHCHPRPLKSDDLRPHALEFALVLRLLRLFASCPASQATFRAKIKFAFHVAQHITWDLVTSDELTEFCRMVYAFCDCSDPLLTITLSDVFTELCSVLLPTDPVRWAPIQGLLVKLLSSGDNTNGSSQDQHSGATASDLLMSRAEVVVLSLGGLARQLANFQSADALQNGEGNTLMLDTESPLASGLQHRQSKRRRSSINCLSVDHPEFVYYDLLKEIIAGLCRVGFVNQHSHSVIGAACVQIEKLAACLESSKLSILRDSRKQIAQVLVEHLDPSMAQAFETVARIFQLDKVFVVRELIASTFTFLVIKRTQESHLRIHQLIDQCSWLTGIQDYVAKITQLCILPDTLVYIFTRIVEDQQLASLKFLESHLGLSIERVARMNDVSRLLHQFVLCLYPHRREACAGLRWLVSKVVRSAGRPIHGLLLGHTPEVRAEAALSDVTTVGLADFLQQHLCGILAFFDSRLLDDESPLEDRRRSLLSLAIFMDLVGSQPVSRMRAKFIATLKLCLRYKFVEPNTVVQLWTMFLKMLETDALIELLPDLGANLVSLYSIAPDRVSEAFDNMFVKRRNQLETSISRLFFLPILPGLDKFEPILNATCPWRALYLKPTNQNNELQLPPPPGLSELLNAWLSALTHSSRSVRRLCLASLAFPSSAADSPLVAASSMDTSGLLSLSRLTVRALKVPAGGGDASAMPLLFTQLITCLLTGLTRDADKEIRLLYAQWLGALGVIDPSRLALSACGNEETPVGSVENAINWFRLFPFDVLMELAKIYMRAASPKQLDSTALAIQELLRLLNVPGSCRLDAPSNANVQALARFISGSELWTQFPQNVQDLFTPLLNSRYVIEAFTDWTTIQSPIIEQPSCHSYESWIRLWSGSLKVYVSEPIIYRLFQVCEPVVKSDVEFARYLLNHVAKQILTEGSQIGVLKLRAEILGVLELVANSEQPTERTTSSPTDFLIPNTAHLSSHQDDGKREQPWQAWYPLAAQTVFSLLDHLSAWQRARSADRSAVVAAIAKPAGASSSSRTAAGGGPASTLAEAGGSGGGPVKPSEEEKSRLTDLNLGITRISEFVEGLPHKIQARASLRIWGLGRALRHWEMAFAEDEVALKSIYVTGFVDHSGLKGSGELISSIGQESLIGLLDTYAALHDTDGLSGVLALMQRVGIQACCGSLVRTGSNSMTSYQSSMLRALQLENQDQLDMACATYEHALTAATAEGADDADSRTSDKQLAGLHAGLFRCQLPDPARLQSMFARTDALLREEGKAGQQVCADSMNLNTYRTEAAIRLADWEKLDEAVASGSSANSWSVGLGKVLLSLRGDVKWQRRICLDNLRLGQMSELSTAALEGSRGYLRAYEPIVRLSLLTEIEAIAGLAAQLANEWLTPVYSSTDLSTRQKNSDLLIENLLAWLDARLQQSRSTLHTLEPVLAIRHSTLQLVISDLRKAHHSSTPVIMATTDLNTKLKLHQLHHLDLALANSWLQRAKLARKAGQVMAAYTCVLHAEFCGSPGALIERSKLLWQTGKREAALTCLDEGLGSLSKDLSDTASLANTVIMPPPNLPITSRTAANLRQTNKVVFTVAGDNNTTKACNKQALLLRARYCEETSRFDFDTTRRLYSEICEAFVDCEEAHFRLAHYVDEARNQASKQHDLLLKVALEHYGKALACGSQFIYQSMPRFLALWLDFGSEFARKHGVQQSGNVRTSKSSDEMTATFEEVQQLMKQSLANIPPYQFYTALGQILSRVCHEHPSVICMLVDLIVRIFEAYPQQTIWFLMSLHNSTVPQRRDRCQQIFAAVKSHQKSLSQFVNDCVALCSHLRTICSLFMSADRRELKSFSIRRAVQPLTRLLETSDLSQVLIPVHRQLVPILLRPRASSEEVRGHQPFGATDRFACLSRLEDSVDILGSQTRPKKMYWVGTDGRRYVIVAKPNDDLRKDSRLMELNGIINKFLLKNPDTRHRSLQIRTYAVIPLSEHGGLIEWACNTQPFRSILTKLHVEIGRPINWANMSRLAPALEDPLEVKRDKFLNKWLPMYPLVFYRWFLHGFPNPCAWYAARESFARTCAVMSMVGYVLGLGDRHTENILFDSTTGGLVHVDFSCVFNTGLTLPWPERVPFRLTRNLVHALGPTGYEGTFRRCAEVTMRLLRREIHPLMAVFRPIYFDALVEQGNLSAGRPAVAADDVTRRSTAARRGAVSSVDDERITRAAMEKLIGMEDRLHGKITEHDDFGQLLPMSVEGQVDTLIKEATSVDRLCQMYKGWMPFL